MKFIRYGYEKLTSSWSSLVIFAVLSLIAIIPLLPMLVIDGWPRSHEDLRYIILFEHFREVYDSGIFYPRWLPDLFGGYGYPTFIFYQPGVFYSILPFSYLSNEPITYMTLTLSAICLVAAIGCYLLCRGFSDRVTSIFCSALFLITPYLYVNLYVRGDLSEVMGMLLTPWPLYFLVQLNNKIKQNATASLITVVSLAISILLIVISHPAVALFFIPIISCFAFRLGLDLENKQRALLWINFTLAACLAITLCSPYWFSLFQLRDYTAINSTTESYFAGKNHVVYFSQLFSREWGRGISVPGIEDTLSFQLGIFHFLAALAGFLCYRTKPFIQVSFVLYLLCILMMMPFAAPIWQLPLLNFVQFPWRILAVTAILQVICASGLCLVVQRHLRLKSLAMLLLFIGMIFWHKDQFKAPPMMEGVTSKNLARHITKQKFEFTTHAVLNEMLPKTVLTNPVSARRGTPLLQARLPARSYPLPTHTKNKIQYQISSGEKIFFKLNQIYLPGWVVEINGVKVAREKLESGLDQNGLVNLTLPAGNYSVTAYYEAPPGWVWRNLVIFLISLSILYGARKLNQPLAET